MLLKELLVRITCEDNASSEVNAMSSKVIASGQLMADSIESIFSGLGDTITNAFKGAFDFISNAITQNISSWEQAAQSAQVIYGSAADTVIENAKGAAKEIGLSASEYMDGAQRYGALLVQSHAENRAKMQETDADDLDLKKHNLDVELSQFKSNLSAQLDARKQQLTEAYDAQRDAYADEYDALSESLSDQLDLRKRQLSDSLSELRSSLSDEYDALSQSLTDQYNAKKDAYSKELSALRESLSAEYDSLKSALDSQTQAVRDAWKSRIATQKTANSTELSERKSALNAATKLFKQSMDDEVSAFKSATKARIKEIDREYTEKLKLIDEDEYRRVKALQDQIDALDAQGKAEKKARKRQQQDEELAAAKKAVDNAVFRREKEAAEKAYTTLLAEIEQDRLEDERDALKESLENQIDAVHEEANNRRAAAKTQHDETKDSYQEQRSIELTELQRTNSAKLDARKAADAEELNQIKLAQNERIQAMESQRDAEVRQVKESNDAQLKQKKSDNQRILAEVKDQQQRELSEMQRGNKEQLKQKKADNEKIIKEQERANADLLKEQQRANEDILDAKKDEQDKALKQLQAANQAELDEMREHNRRLIDEQSYLTQQQKKSMGSGTSGWVDRIDEDYDAAAAKYDEIAGMVADMSRATGKPAAEIWRTFESLSRGIYTTVDNLGLGIHQSKAGVQEMLNMAESVALESGQFYSFSIDNFEDIVTALGIIIDKYGFQGTAAWENAHTVEGALMTAGASWDNWINALGSYDDATAQMDLGEATTQLVQSVTTAIEMVVPQAVGIIEKVIGVITENGPRIIETVKTAILNSLPEDVRDNAERIIEQIDRFFGNIGDIIGRLGGPEGILEIVTDTLVGFGDSVNKVVEFFEPFAPLIADVVSQFIQWSPILATVLGTLGLFKAVGGFLITVVSNLGAIVAIVEQFAGPVALVVGIAEAFKLMYENSESLREGIDKVKKVFEDAFGKIDEALKPLKDTWDKFTQNVGKFFGDIGDTLVNVFGPLLQGFLESTKPAVDMLYDSFTKLCENISGALETLGTGFMGLAEWLKQVTGDEGFQTFMEVLGIFVGFVADVVIVTLKLLLDILGGIAKAIIDAPKAIEDLINSVGGFLTSAGQALEGIGKALIQGLWNGIQAIWQEVANFFTGLLQWIINHKGPVEEDREALKPAGEAIMNGLFDGISAIWEGIQQFFGDLLGNILGFFDNSATWLLDKGKEILQGLKDGIDDVWNGITDFFGGMLNNFVGFFNDAKNWLFDKGKEILDGLHDGIKNIWENVKKFFEGIPTNIKNFFNNSPTWLLDKGKEVLDGLKKGIEEKWEGVTSFFRDLPDNIVKLLGDTGELLVSAGKNILIGFYNGLVEIWNEYVMGFIDGIGQWILDHKGPEEYDKQLLVHAGNLIMQGLQNGLEGGFEGVKNTVSQIANIVQSTDPGEVDASGVLDGFSGVLDDMESEASDEERHMRASFMNMMHELAGVVGDDAGLLMHAGSDIMNSFQYGLEGQWPEVQNFIHGINSWIADNKGPKEVDQKLLTPAGRWIMQGFQSGLRGGFSDVMGFVDEIADAVTDTVNGVGDDVGRTNVDAIDFSDVLSGFDEVLYDAKEMGKDLTEIFKEAFAGLERELLETGSTLTTMGRYIMEGFSMGIETGFDDIRSLVSQMGPWIQQHKGPKEYDLNLLTNNGQWIMESLYKGIERGYSGEVVPYITGMADDMARLLGTPELAVDMSAVPVSMYTGKRGEASQQVMNVYIDKVLARDEREVRELASQLSVLWKTEMEGML